MWIHRLRARAQATPVVFKPSEYTPGVGEWLADRFTEVVGGRSVVQVVTGFAETRQRAVYGGH